MPRTLKIAKPKMGRVLDLAAAITAKKTKIDPRYADLGLAYTEEIAGERVTRLAKQVKSGQDDPGGEHTMS